MRKLGRFEPMLGRAEIGGIQIDVKSRDDIPAILLGLQGLYLNEAVREAVFELLLDRFGEDRDLTVGRPGMELWTVLVLAVLKQGLGCDFDRLHEHANTHVVLRQLLGDSDLDPVTYSYDQCDAECLAAGRGHAARHQRTGGAGTVTTFAATTLASGWRAGATALSSRRMSTIPPTATCSGTQPG